MIFRAKIRLITNGNTRTYFMTYGNNTTVFGEFIRPEYPGIEPNPKTHLSCRIKPFLISSIYFFIGRIPTQELFFPIPAFLIGNAGSHGNRPQRRQGKCDGYIMLCSPLSGIQQSFKIKCCIIKR